MREALHVLCTLVLIPYLALAIAFVLLGQAIASGSVVSFFGTLLWQATWIIPWGILGFIGGICIVVALGLSARFRWLGGLCLGLLAAGCLAVIILRSTSRIGLPELAFLLPCGMVLVYGTWLAVVEWRTRRQNEYAA